MNFIWSNLLYILFTYSLLSPNIPLRGLALISDHATAKKKTSIDPSSIYINLK